LRVEEFAQLLLVLVGLRWIPRDVGGLAFEEIGHEDLVGVVFVRVGEDVGALEGLVEEAEDVIDDEDTLLCVFGTRGVCGRRLAICVLVGEEV
jgi:hypothetical protein